MKRGVSINLLGWVLLLFASSAQAFYNPVTGKWLSRDPIGERGGRNLYSFLANCPLTKADYLGLEDVGTVTVDENHAMSGWMIGWVMRLRWTPPESWRGWDPRCLPCTEAVWIQDRKYDVEYYWWAFNDPDVHTGWGKDWDETDYQGSAVQWDAYAKSQWASTMDDEPHPGNWLQQFKVKSVHFQAKSNVKCIRGRDKGKIYATVEWGFYDFVVGEIEYSGGGITSGL